MKRLVSFQSVGQIRAPAAAAVLRPLEKQLCRRSRFPTGVFASDCGSVARVEGLRPRHRGPRAAVPLQQGVWGMAAVSDSPRMQHTVSVRCGQRSREGKF